MYSTTRLASAAALCALAFFGNVFAESTAPVVVFAHGESARAIDWSGSGIVAKGSIHSNGGLDVGGSNHRVDGATTYVTELKLGGGNLQFAVPPAQVGARAWPMAIDLADYRPGGRAALAAGTKFVDASAECRARGFWERPRDERLADGLYWVPCDVRVSGSNVAASRVTLVSSGEIQVSGSGVVLERSFIDGLLLATTALGNDAVRLTGSGATYGGRIYAPAGQLQVSGSNVQFRCGLFAQTIKLAGSNGTFSGDLCGPPSADEQRYTTPEDTPLPIALSARDPDGRPLVWEIVRAPSHGALTGTAPNLVYAPGRDFYGFDSFAFRVSNGEQTSNVATVRILVEPVNDPPTAIDARVTVQQDGQAMVSLSGLDPDDDDLTFDIATLPRFGTVSSTTTQGLIGIRAHVRSGPLQSMIARYVPNPGYLGDDEFAFVVHDGTVVSTRGTVRISVVPSAPAVQPPGNPPARDPISDAVGASVGNFSVDSSGNASYVLPIWLPPGTAGVMPTLALAYHSGAASGVLGKGWSISGLSTITRCRKSREHGDFIEDGVPIDGNSKPIEVSRDDAFCLDGQRLLVESGEYGAAGTKYRLELDPFTRVTAIGGINAIDGYSGPTSFAVQRKDGSTSRYGATADSRIERADVAASCSSEATPPPGSPRCSDFPALVWALTDFEDSTGNTIEYDYEENVAESHAVIVGLQYRVKAVRYTGKRQLPGQVDGARLPFAEARFHYAHHSPSPERPDHTVQSGYQGGVRFTQSTRLTGIEIRDLIDTTSPRTLRFYRPYYRASTSGSGARLLHAVRECAHDPGSDFAAPNAGVVCYRPTTFRWSDDDGARFAFETGDVRTDVTDTVGVKSVRLGDVDGDGRTDVVWFRCRPGISAECAGRLHIVVGFADRVEEAGESKLTLVTRSQPALETTFGVDEIETGWALFDYNGDGKDDLMLADNNAAPDARWRVYASIGRPGAGGATFDTSRDLINVSIQTGNDFVDQAQFGDFNGDGLIDVLYPTGEGRELAIRFFERGESGFGFSTPSTVAVPAVPGCAGCRVDVFNGDAAGFGVAADFNGDGRADVVLRLRRPQSNTPLFYAFVMDARGSGVQSIRQYGSLLYGYNGLGPTDARAFQFADANGDSLPDLVFRPDIADNDLTFMINTGHGFGGASGEGLAGIIQEVPNIDQVRFVDVDGDGRADVTYPGDSARPCPGAPGSDRVFRYRSYRDANPHFGAFDDARSADKEGDASCVPGNGAIAENPREWTYVFADLDGDAATDFVKLRDGGTESRIYTSRSGSASRHRLRDAITSITNGYGGITRITYQPLTNAAIYRRGAGARSGPAQGRGSPVQDVLGPLYVVSEASSSAPTLEDPNAMSSVLYRYADARMQAGGRGFLGFGEIVTFDANATGNRYVATRTVYRQDFPFVGAALVTEKYLLDGDPSRGSVELDNCASSPESSASACFHDGTRFATPGRASQRVHLAAQLWDCKNAAGQSACGVDPALLQCQSVVGLFAVETADFAPSQQSLFPFVGRTADISIDADAGSQVTSHVCGRYAYDGFGNATQIEMSTFSDASVDSDRLVHRKTTVNTYLNDAVNWRLGRMTRTSTTDARGAESKSRVATFEYDIGVQSRAVTGLLKGEALQKGVGDAVELRTLYDLDEFGNRIAEYRCSARQPDGSPLTDAECRTAGLVMQRPEGTLGPTESVHRYVRHEYDANGRFLVSTHAPYFSPTGPNQVNEQPSLQIRLRDEFGNAIDHSDANGLQSTAYFGALGRAYFAANSTGARSTMTYRWCGTVQGEASCPRGARFRLQTIRVGAATTWTYHDALGREVVKVAQSFNAGVTGKDFTATCVGYDGHGRVELASAPFFLATESASEPLFGAAFSPCLGAPSTLTTYDALGRVVATQPPGSAPSLVAYAGLTTTTTDARGQQTRQAKNALGEVVAVVQSDADSGDLDGPAARTLIVTHEYDAQGNLMFLRRDAGNGVIETAREYDSLGRVIELTDPDRGTTNYTYNATGEVIAINEPRSVQVLQDFDALGRLWRRRAKGVGGLVPCPTEDVIFCDGFEDAPIGGAPAGGLRVQEDTFVFDTAANGLGLIDYEQRTVTGSTSPLFNRAHRYDDIGRAIGRDTSFDGSSYMESTSYDAFGRVRTQTDAAGQTVTTTYSDRGFAREVSDSQPGASGTFYAVLEHDAWGNATRVRRGDAFTTTSTFDANRGWVDTVSTPGLQDWDFDFDDNGNLEQRRNGSLRETFTYDRLNRLKLASRFRDGQPSGSEDYDYDALGNICRRGNITYSYAGADGCDANGTAGSPHAVTRAGPVTYGHDAVGNQTSAVGASSSSTRTIDYDVLEQALRIVRADGVAAEFAYGPDKARYRRVDRSAGGARTTRYVGNVEIILENGVTETKRYLTGGRIVTTRAGVSDVRYMLPDHLGSIDVVVSASGAAVERLSYEPWGQRRDATDWEGLPTSAPATTTRGFTGHEHVDALGIVHMNGRLYDPNLSRFVQADPLLDVGIQGLNRYSYVLNNPLSATDPTGHLSWGQWTRIGISLALGASGQFMDLDLAGQWAFTGASGFMSAAAQSGTLKGAGWGALTAVSFHGIGTYFDGAQWAREGSYVFGTNLNLSGYAAKVVAHGTLGGVVQHLQGGKFGHGFASAGISQALSGAVDAIDPSNPAVGYVSRIAVAGLIGGTVSELSGGKFAHGAVTAAFARAFNDELHSAAEARRLYGGGSAGTGHHWVPFGSTTGEGLDISPEARRVFGQATSGEKLPSSLHNTDHSAYNSAVRGELIRWASSNDIDLSRMTSVEATRFVQYVSGGGVPNAIINNFTAKIHGYNRLAAPLGGAGKFLLRNVLVPAGIVGMAEGTISINQPACVMAPGNPCQR